MKLNIVYGRSGAGKSKYIYETINSKIGSNKIFLVVPEQCNLSAEKKLFEIVNRNSLIDEIENLEKQTIKDFRVIFVDDGSTDNCYSVLQQALQKHPR